VKHVAPRHGTVVHAEGSGPACKGKAGVSLGGHGVAEKPQGYLDRFAIGTVIFLVRDPTAIIDDAQQEEGWGAFAGVEPGRGRELFEIRGADIKLP
jgi:hypothetical protein